MDTASSTLAFAMLLLAQNPDSYHRAQAEIKDAVGSKPVAEWTNADIQALPYLTACVKEALRLFPAASFTGRIAMRY